MGYRRIKPHVDVREDLGLSGLPRRVIISANVSFPDPTAVGKHSLDTLSLYANVAVGLAGFATVSAMLGGTIWKWQAADSLRIRMLLGAAFGAMFGALVPAGLVWGGLSEQSALRGGALVILVTLIYWMVRSVLALRKLDETNRALFDNRIKATMITLSLASGTGQAVVLLGLAPQWDALLISFGILLFLAFASFLYIRLMFVRPRE